MPITVRDGPGQIQEPGTPTRSLMWMAGPSFSCHQSVLTGRRIRSRVPRTYTGALMYDVGVTSGSLPHSTGTQGQSLVVRIQDSALV